MRIHLLGWPLALLPLFPWTLAPTSADATPRDPAVLEEPGADDGFEALAAEYEAAEDAYQRELRRLRGDEREELARRHPAVAFWPRFQRLSDAGDGRALFWMARSARDRHESSEAGREATRKLYAELLRTYAQEDWFGEVVEQLPRERIVLGEEVVNDGLRQVIGDHADRNVQARAMVVLAGELKRSKDPEERAEAEELLRAAAEEYADTEAGAKVAKELRLEVGGLAPDFTGKTSDGYGFELSDYRGKVVLLDFYGFW
jgi:hypothetical protein